MNYTLEFTFNETGSCEEKRRGEKERKRKKGANVYKAQRGERRGKCYLELELRAVRRAGHERVTRV